MIGNEQPKFNDPLPKQEVTYTPFWMYRYSLRHKCGLIFQEHIEKLECEINSMDVIPDNWVAIQDQMKIIKKLCGMTLKIE